MTMLCKRVMRWMQAAVLLAAGHMAEFLGTIKGNSYSTLPISDLLSRLAVGGWKCEFG